MRCSELSFSAAPFSACRDPTGSSMRIRDRKPRFRDRVAPCGSTLHDVSRWDHTGAVSSRLFSLGFRFRTLPCIWQVFVYVSLFESGAVSLFESGAASSPAGAGAAAFHRYRSWPPSSRHPCVPGRSFINCSKPGMFCACGGSVLCLKLKSTGMIFPTYSCGASRLERGFCRVSTEDGEGGEESPCCSLVVSRGASGQCRASEGSAAGRWLLPPLWFRFGVELPRLGGRARGRLCGSEDG